MGLKTILLWIRTVWVKQEDEINFCDSTTFVKNNFNRNKSYTGNGYLWSIIERVEVKPLNFIDTLYA